MQTSANNPLKHHSLTPKKLPEHWLSQMASPKNHNDFCAYEKWSKSGLRHVLLLHVNLMIA